MEIILIFLVLIGLGAVGGWRACKRVLPKRLLEENTYYRTHVADLKDTASYYQQLSSYNKDMQNSIIQNHNTNLSQTLLIVLNLLQKQNKETTNQEEKQQIENIIKTIKGSGGFSSSKIE